MRPAKIQAQCPNCDHEFEARGSCVLHLPDPTRKGKSRGMTRRKFTAPDDRWKQAVKDRDNWTCRRCKKDKSQKQMHAAHIMRSTYKALRPGFLAHTGSGCCLRHDIRNGITLCAGCHLIWSHQYPHEFVVWLREEIGELYDELYDLAHKKKGAA